MFTLIVRGNVSGVMQAKYRNRSAAIGAAIFLVFMLLAAGAVHIARSAQQFEQDRWQARLVVAGRQSAGRVDQWLNDSEKTVRSVAQNPTVQIYMSEAATFGKAQDTNSEEQAKAAFLSIYIASFATRGPFAQIPKAGGQIGGLAVLDSQGRLIASTGSYRPAGRMVESIVAAGRNGNMRPGIAVRGNSSSSVFFAPVLPLQAAGPVAPIGYVVGERDARRLLASTVRSAAAFDHGHETLLARSGQGAWRVLAVTPGFEKRLNANAPRNAEMQAAADPAHLHIGSDLTGKSALSVGTLSASAPWALVESVPVKTALAGVDRQVRDLAIALLCGLLAVIAGVFALWQHGIRAVALQQREQLKAEAGALSERTQLYKSILDEVSVPLMAVDSASRILFVNAPFAHACGLDTEGMAGKHSQEVLPPDWVEAVSQLIEALTECRLRGAAGSPLTLSVRKLAGADPVFLFSLSQDSGT